MLNNIQGAKLRKIADMPKIMVFLFVYHSKAAAKIGTQ